MTNENSKKGVIIISVIGGLVITGVILFLSFSGFQGDNIENNPAAAYTSDLAPGQNNKEVKTQIKPENVAGTYTEKNDGWTYTIVYEPNGEYDGTFSGGFDHNNETVAKNHEKYYTEQGTWKLENGEVKLYTDSVHTKSLWTCGDYMVDSRNYFVGTVPKDRDNFQAAFTCKAGESGDTQILNFYSDGKMIMEIIRNDGTVDSGAESELPPYQVAVGTYRIEGDNIITEMIGSTEKVLYIVDDGIANWVYHKVKID